MDAMQRAVTRRVFLHRLAPEPNSTVEDGNQFTAWMTEIRDFCARHNARMTQVWRRVIMHIVVSCQQHDRGRHPGEYLKNSPDVGFFDTWMVEQITDDQDRVGPCVMRSGFYRQDGAQACHAMGAMLWCRKTAGYVHIGGMQQANPAARSS